MCMDILLWVRKEESQVDLCMWRIGEENGTRAKEREPYSLKTELHTKKKKKRYENLSLTQQPEREKKIIASQKINII